MGSGILQGSAQQPQLSFPQPNPREWNHDPNNPLDPCLDSEIQGLILAEKEPPS